MKIPYNLWAKQNGIPPPNAQKLLKRKILKDPKLKKIVQKKKISIDQWFIDEDVRIEKSENGKWILF